MNVELHSDSELQNEENVHSDSKVSIHVRDAKLPKRDVYSDSNVERPNMETRTRSRLSKYVRIHHPAKKILETRKRNQ